ncbi:flavin prenyltransferase UbiX [uncultured Anaerotruncus sp.]|uniref:UbiX family flavin prenyltransferase n=1 Tax=uncultured Anaerotruncus sp. TaxID=905011 RepID=UPI00280B4BA0|nr:flavin prenyltransferase UbiX [uncultured Anaerotruncus sp.]
MGRYIVGVTGASGTVYAERLIARLTQKGHEVRLCVTDAGRMVSREERDWEAGTPEALERCLRERCGAPEELLRVYPIHAVGADIASGSFHSDGMIVLPCSMGTLSSIAHGASHNLLERAADVMLKERLPLLLVPREAPYNTIHLENMLTLSRLGVILVPASPAFYHRPHSVDELVDFFVTRLLDQLGIREECPARWRGME